MSTRCVILVEGADVMVYRHSDGYPHSRHGVLHDLKPLVKDFLANRGFDPFYLPAQIVAKFVGNHHKYIAKRIKEAKKNKSWDATQIESARSTLYLGFGIMGYDQSHGRSESVFSSDIEYVYVVKRDGTIEVRQPTPTFNVRSNLHNTYVTDMVDVND